MNEAKEHQLFVQHFRHHHRKISTWKRDSTGKGVGVPPTQDFHWGNNF